MLTYLQQPLTRRYPAELFGHGLDPVPAGTGERGRRPHRLGAVLGMSAVLLLWAVLVGLATVALQ